MKRTISDSLPGGIADLVAGRKTMTPRLRPGNNTACCTSTTCDQIYGYILGLRNLKMITVVR